MQHIYQKQKLKWGNKLVTPKRTTPTFLGPAGFAACKLIRGKVEKKLYLIFAQKIFFFERILSSLYFILR